MMKIKKTDNMLNSILPEVFSQEKNSTSQPIQYGYLGDT
jgi:hypothetical protein